MSDVIRELALTIGDSFALSMIAKATVASGGALIAARVARNSRASIRHVLFATAFIVLLVLPAVAVSVPSRHVTVAIPLSAETAGVAAEPPNITVRGSSPRSDADVPTDPIYGWPSASTVALILWLAGTAVVLVPLNAALWRLRRLRHSALPWRHGQAVVDAIARTQGLRGRVHVLVDEDVTGPITAGVIHPIVVLPRDARQWAPAALRHAIIHELEHIRRADWLILCLARVGCALYWFHPFVWMCWRQLRLEAERACDDAVVADADAEVYADQLVMLAERMASQRTGSVLAMASRSDLAARVAAILDTSRPRGPAGSRWTAVTAGMAVLLIAAIAPLRAVAVSQRGAGADLSRLTFDVASIKENRSGRAESFAYPYANAGRLVLVNHTVRQMIRQAFDVRDYQLIGGPDWFDRTRYDIEAKAAGPVTRPQMMNMLRALLEDHYKLVTRRDTREDRILELLQVKPGTLGPKLTPAKPEEARLNPVGALPEGLRGSAATMANLAATLSNLEGQLVVDKTGLTGIFNFTVDYAAERRAPPGVRLDQLPPKREDLPSLPAALREQLGLRLQSGRGPIPVIVIESAQPPSVDGYSASAQPLRSAFDPTGPP